MMKTIFNTFSKQIIQILDPHHNCTKIEYLQMSFGIQILVYNIIVTFSILLFSYICGCFTETLLLFTVFGTLRLIAGGFHFNSLYKCVSITTLIMIGIGKCISVIAFPISFCIVLSIFANIIFFIHIPKGTSKNTYSEKYSQLQKKRLNIIIILFDIAILFINNLREILALSMFIVAIFVLPEIIRRFLTTA